MKHNIQYIFLNVVLFCLFANVHVDAQKLENINITESFRNKPLKDFIALIEEKYGVQVFYKESWLAPYTINNTFENTPLVQALNNVFLDHELKFEIFQDESIFIFRKRLDTRSRFDEQSKFMIVGNPLNIGRYKNAKLKGRVIDGKTGETLVGAVVVETKSGKGATTNVHGEFEMDLPTGEHQLRLSYIGFENTNINLKLIEDGTSDFSIFEESHNIGEVTILGEETDLPRAQMSMVKMTSAELKQLPALMGEVDVLKGLTMLAGVQTVGELASGFNVRGGNTDQNLILVNGSPVFNSAHLFGFLSLINPDVVNDIRLFKGGMPVRLGERISSVMEVQFKDGNSETMRVYGGIGIINSRLTLDGPLSKNKKMSIIAGGRSSYTNWVLQKMPEMDLTNSVTHFYDLSGKLSYKFNAHNKMSLMAYSSNDEFSTSSQSVTRYGNLLGNFALSTRFSEKWYGDLEVSHSQYAFRLTDYANNNPVEAYYLDNMLKYNSAGYNFKYHPDPRHNAEAGFKFITNQLSPGEVSPIESITTIEPQKLYDEKTREWAVYVSDEFEILPQLSVVTGIRYSHFYNIGTPNVYLYDENKPKLPENVVDSIQFGSKQISASYGGFEPRISLSYDWSLNTIFKINYQRTRQYVFQISNSAVVSPAETWKAADYHLKPLIADQIAVGVENDSWIKDIDFSAEIYYKHLQNLIEYRNGARLIMNQYIETALIPTRGFSSGIELSAKKSIGRLTGYASYVFSRTMRKNNSEFNEDNLWHGKYYASMYDRPHDFSVTTTYNLSRRWKVSGNFVFISGRPVTLPELKYDYAGESLVYYSDRNKYRMPPYHRFDVSITFDENLRKKRMWKGSWTLAVYNVYGRNNPYSIYYKRSTPVRENNYRVYSLFKLSVIGIPVPSLTYNFKF